MQFIYILLKSFSILQSCIVSINGAPCQPVGGADGGIGVCAIDLFILPHTDPTGSWRQLIFLYVTCSRPRPALSRKAMRFPAVIVRLTIILLPVWRQWFLKLRLQTPLPFKVIPAIFSCKPFRSTPVPLDTSSARKN